ncbi:TRAP transporter small permease [Salipiger sp. P9]|uniref:TRAP transporter small permease n=1 Tax=Salipiger pentaromativorans TaxID=2943193 RepID=UPI0021587336|nr:TRAP transporter small permease [Salipiger pentaromativorans]MCR8551042.1 TRAP transporter small permease [Salipiger pentaromativorans]
MKWIDENLEEAVVVFLMTLITGLIGLQIFMRYVMGASLSWSEELARYCFIWMSYIGVAYAVRRNVSIATTVLADALPSRGLRLAVSLFAHIVFAAFALLVVSQGITLVQKISGFGQKSASLGLPMAYVYAAPVVGFALTLIRLMQRIVLDLRAYQAGDPA